MPVLPKHQMFAWRVLLDKFANEIPDCPVGRFGAALLPHLQGRSGISRPFVSQVLFREVGLEYASGLGSQAIGLNQLLVPATSFSGQQTPRHLTDVVPLEGSEQLHIQLQPSSPFSHYGKNIICYSFTITLLIFIQVLYLKQA